MSWTRASACRASTTTATSSASGKPDHRTGARNGGLRAAVPLALGRAVCRHAARTASATVATMPDNAIPITAARGLALRWAGCRRPDSRPGDARRRRTHAARVSGDPASPMAAGRRAPGRALRDVLRGRADRRTGALRLARLRLDALSARLRRSRADHARRTLRSTKQQARSGSMAQIDGGDLVARMLKREGIDTIFTLSGGHIQNIY